MFKNFIDIFYYWNYFDNHSAKSGFFVWKASKITRDYSNCKLRKLIIDESKLIVQQVVTFLKILSLL